MYLVVEITAQQKTDWQEESTITEDVMQADHQHRVKTLLEDHLTDHIHSNVRTYLTSHKYYKSLHIYTSRQTRY